MKTLSYVLIVISLMLSFACSNEQAIVVENSGQDQKLSDDNVFKDYETVLDKANSVEQTILDAAEARKKEIEGMKY